MAQVAGFLPPIWQTWIELLAPSMSPSSVLAGAGLWKENQQMRDFLPPPPPPLPVSVSARLCLTEWRHIPMAPVPREHLTTAVGAGFPSPQAGVSRRDTHALLVSSQS